MKRPVRENFLDCVCEDIGAKKVDTEVYGRVCEGCAAYFSKRADFENFADDRADYLLDQNKDRG